MKEAMGRQAAEILRQCRVAALGTLHDGAPSVTMTPFAVLPAPFALIVLVSGLSAHTRDMHADPRVGMLIAQPEREGEPVHALARVVLQGEARPLAGQADEPAAKASYRARFAEMEGLFALADFGLFAIRPTTVRVVAGFAQAHSISPETLAREVQGTPGVL